MKNKGFTLAELIAVISVLGIICILVVPKINNIIKKQYQEVYENQLKILIDSAKKYVANNANDLDYESSFLLTVDELYNEGYLNKNDVINPMTNEKITSCVAIRWQNNQYEYEIDDDCQL